MLINDEEDEEDDEDHEDDDDDDGVDAADDGDDDDDDDDEDEDDEDEDEDEEGEDEDENEDDDPLPAGNLLSGGIGGDQGARGGDFKVSTGPAPCLFLAKARATSASTASFRDMWNFDTHHILSTGSSKV